MGITTEQYEKIIRFLDAGMEPAEMDEFEKEMAASPEMRYQLDFEQSIRDGFALRNMTHLPGIPPANGNAAVPITPGKVTSMRKWLTIPAALIAACLVFALFWQKTTKNPGIAGKMDTSQKASGRPRLTVVTLPNDSSKVIDLALLFKQHFKKDVLPDRYPLFLAEALMDYESGNYTTLQRLNLSDLPQTRGVNETDSKENILKWGHYFKGLAFLQTDDAREAAINLDWVLNNQPGKALRAKTQWYLALAYLKENEGEKAAELCRRIVDNKENQALVIKAEKILDALKK